MIFVPEMLMIGGNSRNSGKTTMACNCISQLSAEYEIIGLKVTSVRPGEEDLHGNHDDELSANFTITEEKNRDSSKDTSEMLRAGASQVYYIRVEEIFTEKAIVQFLSGFKKEQLIVCESRSLRKIIVPGLFLMMMRFPLEREAKDTAEYLKSADRTFYFGDTLDEIKQFSSNLIYKNGKFVWEC